MDRIQAMKEFYEKGWSIAQLSREFNHSRKTIRNYLKEGKPVNYLMSKERPSLLRSQFYPLVEKWIIEDEQEHKKQRRTALRIFELLKEQYNYHGSYESITSYVREIRGKRREVFVPRNHEAGECLEFDFGYAKVILNGERVQVAMHCYQLTYSNDIYVCVSLRETQEEIFASHKQAFIHFGGIPQKVRYDNLSQVVKKVFKGKKREEQSAFRNFKEKFGFESEFCEVAKGWQKGDVEGCVGYVRRNFFSPVPKIESLASLNHKLASWCQNLRKKRKVHGTESFVGELFQLEQKEFMSLPEVLPEVGKPLVAKSNGYSLITVDKVRYSVPSKHAYETLDVLLTNNEVIAFVKEAEIARHPRSFETGKEVYNPLHYIPVFHKKPGSLIHSKLLHEMPKSFKTFFKKANEKGYDSLQDCIKILNLLKTHSLDEVCFCLDAAIEYHTYHYQGVLNLLNNYTLPEASFKDCNIKENSPLDVLIPAPNLTQYNQFIPGGGSI